MTSEQRASLEARRTQVLADLKQKQAMLISKFAGPEAKAKRREILIGLIKEALNKLGIVPGKPGSDKAAADFIASLPPEMIAILSDEPMGASNLSNLLSSSAAVPETPTTPTDASTPTDMTVPPETSSQGNIPPTPTDPTVSGVMPGN